MMVEITNEELVRLKAQALEMSADGGNWTTHIGSKDLLALIAKVESLAADAEWLGKLLEFCTEAKLQFGPRGELRAMTMKFKNSVETSVGYRNELRKLIDEIQPAGNTKKEKA